MKQFLLSFEPGEKEHRLTGKDFHYLIRVRRYRVGDCIPSVSPGGGRFTMTIVKAHRNSCQVDFQSAVEGTAPGEKPMTRITLIPSLIKGKKMDLVVRYAVEAGVATIWPVETEFSQVRFRDLEEGNRRCERWKRIASEARQQCGGSFATEIASPVPMAECLDRWNFATGPLVFFHEVAVSGGSSLHRHLAQPLDEMAIMVGPEGGFSPAEIKELFDRGGRPVYLGARILRAETAALYGIAAAATIMRERNEWYPA